MVDPNAFNTLSNLEQLDLSQNKLKELRQDMWNGLESLNILWLNGNNIRNLPSAGFRSLTNLKDLYLFENKITDVNSDIWIGLRSLRSLYLGTGYLDNSRGNYITKITPGTFSTLVNLQYLSRARNKLKEINGDMWQGLDSLKTLNLGSNNINWIEPHGFSNLPHLSILELQNNKLSTLTPDVFNPDDYPNSNGHPKSLELDISKNTLHCDGDMCWIRQGELNGWITHKLDTQPTVLNVSITRLFTGRT